MIRNYIKAAWRSLKKHRFFTIINVLGLAIGVAAFWIIALYVTDEYSYDRYNEKADRVFRVVQHGKWDGGSFDLAVTSAPYAGALKADYADVEDAVRIDLEGGGTIVNNNKHLEVGDIAFTDKGVFNIFSYHFLNGDPATALAKPQCIVLTKSLAERIFGNTSAAINKTILFDGNYPNLVTGIIDDVPVNSTFRFSALRSFDANYSTTWTNAGIYTFVLLKHPDDYKKIEAGSEQFYNKYLKSAMPNSQYSIELQPLTSIHLRSHLDYEMSNNGNIAYVYLFSIVALLVLIIAVINYVNLTTARSTTRVKEIGIRKVIGSGRKNLVWMLFSESLLLAFAATAAGLFLADVSLPYFNHLSGKNFSIWYFGVGQSILIFVAFAFITGFISGIYPALFLSGFKVIPALKGQTGSQSTTIFFRKSLVVFQFAVTIVMIIGSTIIYRQLNYVSHRSLGFNRSEMLTFHIHSKTARRQIEAIKTQLLQSPLILSVAAAGNPIGNNDIGSSSFNLGPDGKPSADTKIAETLIINEDFIPAMQIQMADGRNFLKGPGDSATNAVIINETLVQELGWQDAVGKRIINNVNNGTPVYSTVVGVVKDFNTYSLQHKISPLLLTLPSEANDLDNLYVRVSKNNIAAALNYMQAVYKKFDAESKVNYHFLDDNFASQYQTEEEQGKLLLIFTILAVCIACLGLFGLVTFTAEQRVKEISIRKVLGASIVNIVTLLSRELLTLVIVAAIVACPIAWFATSKWLQNFAYHVSPEWWVFGAAGVVAVLIAFLTTSAKSIKAAMTNPAENLKDE